MKKLLYLSFAFPPGIQITVPGINPAGHKFETEMFLSIRNLFDIKSVGVLPFYPSNLFSNADLKSGITHDLILVDKRPEILNRIISLHLLKKYYLQLILNGWIPDYILVYNLSPIYNNFLVWLKRHTRRPKIILLLLDSAQLGSHFPILKRVRYFFKPLVIRDLKMLPLFDACVGLSKSTRLYFKNKDIPFLWMPGACSLDNIYEKSSYDRNNTGPIQFGYFGALAPHSGIIDLLKVFLKCSLPIQLKICGFGRLSTDIAKMAQSDRRLIFSGLLPTIEDCRRFVGSCDVLVNPRPLTHGNQNNFPSKIFEYAICKKSILTTRISGVYDVLGSEAFYLDEANLEDSLHNFLDSISKIDRNELARRGSIIFERVTSHFSWNHQANSISNFINSL